MNDATRWNRVKGVFQAALDREPHERAAFLRETCGDDRALQTDVESLLAADAQADSFAQHSAIRSLDSSTAKAIGDALAAADAVLTAGDHLGPYEILGPVGAGGMGEVYKARDTRLDRSVAIKVLPSPLATDRQFRSRFDREKKAIATLTHPHICTLYDVGHQDGTDYLVMEYVDGETLAARLRHGALPLDDALAYASEIADALEAAHEKGIIHRDLKPANIRITPAGALKVLDFGLAKIVAPESTADISTSPTMPEGGTREGIILGTAAYMSPEQARGQAVDKRTDIWAFGCVCYEMLTGRAAFARATMTDTLAAILDQEPDWAMLPEALPATIWRLLQRCLEKDPKRRLHDIADARIELDDARDVPATTPSGLDTSAAPSRSRRWLLALVAVVGLGMLAWERTMYLQHAPVDTRAVRTTVLPPANVSTAVRVPAQRLAISPDGQRLAFVAADVDGRIQLWVRPLDELDARSLPGTEDANYPFWSPDSRFVAFYAQGKLKRIDVNGGSALTLCDAGPAPNALGGTWNQDGIILFGSGLMGPHTPIYRVSASGGAPVPVTTLDAKSGETGHWAPFFLPDGQHFLYLALGPRGFTPLGIYVGSLNSKDRKLVLRGGSNAKYAQGHLLFLRGTTLMAQAFDVRRLELTGDAAPIAQQVQVGGSSGATGAFTVSDAGVLAYEAGPSAGGSELVWLDREGKLIGSVGPPGDYYGLQLSPDERRIAVTRRNDSEGSSDFARVGDLWIFDLIRGTSSRFTFNGEHNAWPIWAPDGSRLAFVCGAPDHYDVCLKGAGGADEAQTLLTSDKRQLPTDWSPDGRYIIYQVDTVNTPSNLWVLPLFGDRKPTPFLRTKFWEREGRLSPDGRWMAYTSDQDGLSTGQVYVRRFPAAGGPWQVSTQSGEAPRWRGDGKELFYVANDGTVMVVAIHADSTFDAGVPRALFHPRMNRFHSILNGVGSFDYAVTADGERFLVNAPVAAGATPITVVQNWTAGLKK